MEEKRALLVLWTTGRCNLRCRYCYAADKPGGDMDWETARRAIDRLQGTPFRIQFAGGEPTLNLALMERVAEYVAGRGVPMAVQTNAAALTDRCVELIRRHAIAVGVSLDGKPAVNEKLRGDTKRVIEGILRLREAGIMVNLNAVVTQENVRELPELAGLVAYLGNVRGIGLDLLRRSGRAIRPGAPEVAERGQIAEMLRKLHARIERMNRILPQPIRLREVEEARRRLRENRECGAYCYASMGWSWVVLPDGEVYPCGSLAGDARYRMGNVRGEIRPVILPQSKQEKCESCEYERICPGGCPSRALLCGGFSPQDCALRRAAFEIAEKEM